MDTKQLGVAPRINGGLLSNFQGKYVTLVGKVLNQNGQIATFEASDGQQVTVQLSPGQHYNSQYVEITGEVNSDLTVRELKSCEYGDSFSEPFLHQMMCNTRTFVLFKT
mmetsp:Transcript_10388/g.16780  ORF Transcript_10388/g.16780 Transcript_10388/m.16780 type:complete len:109 (+) Transcript_10388:28-354(+)